MRRAWMILALSVLASFPLAGSASAAVTFQVVPDQTTVNYPSTTEIGYSVVMTTDAEQQERFELSYEVPAFGRPDGPLSYGSSISTLAYPMVTGAGTISEPPGPKGYLQFGCVPLHPSFHGFQSSRFSPTVTLPASSVTTMHFRFAVAREAPWPGTSYAPTFIAYPFTDSGPSTLSSRVSLPAPALNVTGPSGVALVLWTKPAPSPADFSEPRTIKKGKRISIFGTSTPALRRQFVQLWTAFSASNPSTQPGVRRVAKIRTGRGGHFAYKGLRLKKAGGYSFYATYSSQRPELASDFSCATTITAH